MQKHYANAILRHPGHRCFGDAWTSVRYRSTVAIHHRREARKGIYLVRARISLCLQNYRFVYQPRDKSDRRVWLKAWWRQENWRRWRSDVFKWRSLKKLQTHSHGWLMAGIKPFNFITRCVQPASPSSLNKFYRLNTIDSKHCFQK